MKKIFFIVIILVLINYNVSYTENYNELEKQEKEFKIGNFIKETKKYIPDYLEDIDLNNEFNNIVKGKINNKKWLQKIVKLFGINISENIKTIVKILSIILIHSILKALTEDLGKSEVTKIVYYVQYLLIVTLITENFISSIKLINETIINLLGFTKTLIPLLITLMIFTGNITTSTILEPIILFLVEFISNIIKNILIPLSSAIIVLIIISKITEKVQINKLTKFMKSSVVWILGVTMTVFIGIISLEGNLSASIDGITAKTTKAAVSNLIPIVRKNNRRWC